jgi:hypothetical protein
MEIIWKLCMAAEQREVWTGDQLRRIPFVAGAARFAGRHRAAHGGRRR